MIEEFMTKTMLNQTQIARLYGYDQRSVSAWLLGNRRVPREVTNSMEKLMREYTVRQLRGLVNLLLEADEPLQLKYTVPEIKTK